MENIQVYEFDITGQAPENAVLETHPIGEYGVFIAKAGTFFKEGSTFRIGERDLIPGTDFDYILYDSKAHQKTGQVCYTGIVLRTDPQGTTLSMTYQAVGGRFARYQEQIIRTIEELGLISRIIHLDDVIGVPEVFPPAPHKTNGADLIGLGRVLEMLARIRDAILEGNPDSVAAARAIADAAVVAYGQINPKPLNGAVNMDVNDVAEVTQDILIPRSEAQDQYTQIEFSFVGPLGSGHGSISYLEGIDVVNNIRGWYTADASVTKLAVGLTVTNNNKTLLRLYNEADAKPFASFFLKSLNTSDDTKFPRYHEVTALESPDTNVTVTKTMLVRQ